MNGPEGTSLEMIDAAIAMIDAEGTIVGWTQAAQRLLGYPARDVVGCSAAILLTSAEDRAKAATVAEQCRAGAGWYGLAEIRHRDGRKLTVRLRVERLSGQGREALWLVSAIGRTAIASLATSGSLAMPIPVAVHLLPSLPIGVVLRDTELRCTWLNATWELDGGIPVRQRLGLRLTEEAPGSDSEALEVAMRQVLETGTPAIDVEYRMSLPKKLGRERALAVSYSRLEDADGHALGVCGIVVDVTSYQRAHERIAILSQATCRIGSTLDVMQTAQEVADFAVPLLADHATVELAESVPLGEAPPHRVGPTGGCIPAFRRAGLAAIRSGATEPLFARGEPVFVPPISPYTAVLSSGRSHLDPVLDTSSGTWLDQDPVRAKWLREDGTHSLMIVPIHVRGSVLGIATFARTKDPVPFDADDLLLAEELVGLAALPLDNARQYERERCVALALQRHLLPDRATGGPAAEVAWRYLPADSHHGVGGDWFDVIPLSGARIALVVGDVVGHGINAVATMGQLRTAVHTLAHMDLSPAELLAHLDELVVRLGGDDDAEDLATVGIGATCLYAVYDPVTRRCTMARAGHPPPAIIDPHGGLTFPDLPAGTPLGLGLALFESVTMELPEGSVLALYTDGLIEARDQDIDVGMDRLGAALACPGLPLDDLCSTVVDALPTQAPGDDATLLLARTRSLGPDRTASWEFPAHPAVVGRARALATRRLAEWGLGHLAESTELIVSELVTNAVRHGAGPIRLRLMRHQFLTCEVYDTGCRSPRLRHPRTTDENGRGLFLVAQLSRNWGTRHTPDGKLIWVEQQLTPHA
ncbi:SpoIIE family protein phosphatase [Streptomyces chiangmaiensis]|uniref:SpoIIE family protein phosphatase n=1 Tax=Streptomyces chiangmaiensis TaxID=766497 RepID=A0ABU7FSW0_9ACTN|nr:SpoIIE family protein phosphatase [Streptomyces chiangmaiensis]MED7827172.1 SpoIIE family protein phosphatase [Streptomyces chiangmaiensis]